MWLTSILSADRRANIRCNSIPENWLPSGSLLPQVEQALAANNINAGGGFIERGAQAINVRAVGLMQTTDDIGATVVKARTARRFAFAIWAMAQARRFGSGKLERPFTAGRHDLNDDDVVEGIVLLRKGAVAETTLDAAPEDR